MNVCVCVQSQVPQRPVGGDPAHRSHAVRRQGVSESHQDKGTEGKEEAVILVVTTGLE